MDVIKPNALRFDGIAFFGAWTGGSGVGGSERDDGPRIQVAAPEAGIGLRD